MQAFDELMAEIDNNLDWNEDKKERIRKHIGGKSRHERTFQRCYHRGREIARMQPDAPGDEHLTENVKCKEKNEDFSQNLFDFSATTRFQHTFEEAESSNNNLMNLLQSTNSSSNQIIQGWLDNARSRQFFKNLL